MKVKDPSISAQKFVTNGQNGSQAYQQGVANAGQAWAQNTAAAEGSYGAGVQAAITRGAFKKGVAKAGAAKYQTNAVNKGGRNYGPGIAAAHDAWVNGVTPYLNTLKSLTLPPRAPKGDPSNMNRATAVALALRKQKVGA